MIKEWLEEDGRIAQYDIRTGYIQYLNSSRVNVEAPRPATQIEQDRFYTIYPEYQIVADADLAALKSALMTALMEVRAINADNSVTTEELNSTLPAVVSSLEQYRDYLPADTSHHKLAILLLAQSVLSIQLLLTNANSGISAAITQSTSVRQDLDQLRAEFDAFTNP